MFRAVVLLGLALGVVLSLGLVSRRRVSRWLLLIAAGAGTVLSAWLAVDVVFGSHLTERWIFVFPAGVAAAGGVGTWSVFDLVRARPSITRT